METEILIAKISSRNLVTLVKRAGSKLHPLYMAFNAKFQDPNNFEVREKEICGIWGFAFLTYSMSHSSPWIWKHASSLSYLLWRRCIFLWLQCLSTNRRYKSLSRRRLYWIVIIRGLTVWKTTSYTPSRSWNLEPPGHLFSFEFAAFEERLSRYESLWLLGYLRNPGVIRMHLSKCELFLQSYRWNDRHELVHSNTFEIWNPDWVASIARRPSS